MIPHALSLLALFLQVPRGGERAALARAAHASVDALRVCADPAGLPFSNDKREGFENRIAEIVAHRLGTKVEYTWWVQRRGFVRSTLGEGACDVVMGVPAGLPSLRTTRPYYRSTFAFVTRRGSLLADLRSIDDARLGSVVIGVPVAGDDGANPAPLHALGRRGIVNTVRGFPLYGETGRDLPAAADAVAKGEIDVAVLWGPVAGFAVRKSVVPLVATPLAQENDGPIPLTFEIAMGVRRDDGALASKLDGALADLHSEIAAVLRAARVPLLPIVHLPEETRRVER